MSDVCDRVQKLVVGRRSGTISMRQFKAQIENFTNAELASLAATLLETAPGKRKRLERALLREAGNSEEALRSQIRILR